MRRFLAARLDEPERHAIALTDREIAGAILIADSTGRIVEDLQPMTRLGLSCVAEQDGKKETNGYNVAGRADIGYYSPERLERIASSGSADLFV